jgi:hypothetical protein
MAARPLKKIDFTPIMTYLVATGQTTTAGYPVIFSGSEDEIGTNSSTPDAIIGIALDTCAAGTECRVALLGPVIPMLVGTGGSTYGVKQQPLADGVTDAAAHDSSGAVDDVIIGLAMQSGAHDDMIGVMVMPSNRGAAS